MLLSRFWYIVLSAALAAVLFLVYLASAVSNRDSQRTAGGLLAAASKAVRWYITDDARKRAGALVPLALSSDVREGLSEASEAGPSESVDDGTSSAIKKKLQSFREAKKGGVTFDALWAVDTHGRAIANVNFEQGTSSEYFEMGGYSLVADALHGWVRDDSWVIDGRILRVVGHPVETAAGGAPVGAIIGGKWVDDRYAEAISDSTGAAVAFYANAERIATGAPVEFPKASLEVHSNDIEKLNQNENYQKKGRTAPMVMRENDAGHDTLAVFARMPGEAWDLGAGYVVAHRQATVSDPLEFEELATESDMDSVPLVVLILIAAGAALIGLILTVIEHTLPLSGFKRATADLADKKSDTDVLKPSTFRGTYKKIAQSVNDALDKVAAQSGVDRGPADLEQVLGPLPSRPQMSAFSVPDGQSGEAEAPSQPASSEPRTVPKPKKTLPKPPTRKPQEAAKEAEAGDGAAEADEPGGTSEGEPAEVTAGEPAEGAASEPGEAEAPAPPKPPSRPKPPAKPASAPENEAALDDGEAGDEDEETEWRRVYEQFVEMKKKFGEPTDKLTYEKFRGTLQRNKEALIARHGCEQVKFRVYEKQGRAALKASPVKE